MTKIVLIQGASGALGRALVSAVKKRNWIAVGAGAKRNEAADFHIELQRSESAVKQREWLSSELKRKYEALDAVLCVSGGFHGGKVSSPDFISSYEDIITSSMISSSVAAGVASDLLRPGGLLLLSGSAAALNPTPWAVAYGSAKAAVHHLVRSLGAGMVERTVVGIAPRTLDTEVNRAAMPKADRSTWTSTDSLANKICDWILDASEIKSGSIIKIETKEGKNIFTQI